MKELAAAAFIFSMLTAGASAQSGPPTAGRPPKPRASVNSAFSCSYPENFASRRAALRGEASLGSAAGLEFRTGAEVTHIRTLGDAYFPPELYKAAFSLTAEDRATRLAINLNSNSDRPFYSPSETDLGFTFSRLFSERSSHSWFYGLNYSTRRTFSRTLPLPFIGYRYTTKDLVIFFPFLVRWQATEKVAFAASYQPVRYFKLTASWRARPSLSVSLEGGTGLEQFLPAGRAHKSEALYNETSFLTLKPEYSLSRRLRLGAELGWQFRGLHYLGDAYNDYHAKTRTGRGPSAGLSAGYSF